MTGHTRIEKKLWEHRWMGAVFAGALLAALVLVLTLKSGPAEAACPITGCDGGGTHTETVNATLTVTNNQPSQGKVISSDSQINCGLGVTMCSHTYSYTVTCDNTTGECTPPTSYPRVSLTPSTASGYSFLGWGDACSGTGSCFVEMDSNKSVSATFRDVTPPAVSLTSPASNARVGSSFTASANASDATGITRVEFLVDGAVKATDTFSPYTVSIDTTGLSDGSHTVSARATDGNGLQATSSRTVTVDRTSPTVTKSTPTGTRVSPRANAVATFSEAMMGSTVEAPGTFTLKKKGTTRAIGATVVYSEPTATTFKAVLNPSKNLKAGATYIATVSSAATDLAGNPLVKKTWKFTVKR